MAGFAKQAGTAVRWLAVAQMGKRILQVITTAVLAHLLPPRDFGVVGLAAIITDFALIFRDLGTSTAIIRRDALDPGLLHTVFWANLAFAVATAGVIVAGSPWAAAFFSEPALAPVLNVLALAFVVAGSSILHQALLERELAFDRIAKVELLAAGLGSAFGIAAAWSGFGVWSLVLYTLASQTLQTLFLWRASRWRPAFSFHAAKLREISGFSLHLTASQVVGFLWRNADNVLVGRYLGATALGYYSIAYRIMLYPLQAVSHVVGRALFPVYARFQDDPARFRSAYIRVSGAIALLTFPMMAGVMALHEPFVAAVLGQGWEPVGTLLIILAPIGMSQSIATTTGLIYQTFGRTDIMLRWGIFACVTTIAGFVVGLRWGIVGVAGSFAVVTVFLSYPSFAVPFRIAGLRWREFGKPLAAPFAASVLMALVLAVIDAWLLSAWRPAVRLGLLVALGAAVYAAAMVLLNRERVNQVWRLAFSRP